ncbi:hypothetical protein ACNPFE_02720 [Klebsiella pneumoniae]
MTSKLTRERIELIANFHRAMALPPSHAEIEELARMALAAMDSESAVPVAEIVSIYGDPEAFGEREIRPLVGIQQMPYGTKLYRHAQPAPVVPDAYVRDERGRMMLNGVCEPKIGFGTGWNACRAAMLKAQPQNAPQNIPEIIPDCWCRTCRPVVLNDMRFVVCPDCGNKRCPRANDHRNACTGSNEPGQEGSAYPAAPQEDINALIPLVSRNEQEVK